MMLLVFYLLKVLVSSGVLFLYYHLFLRNRLFHQWNRFYLLSAVIISLLLPFLQFEIFHNQQEQNDAMQLILIGQSADHYLQEIVITDGRAFDQEAVLLLICGLVSVVLLVSLFYSLHKIYSIIRSHTVNILHNIKFISTGVKGAPFSFLNYIFWNRDIPLQSETGQQIFQHELVHVQEKHTIDKLLMEVVIALFWCNPFFWLIRSELRYIHEFIADEKAVGESGSEAFAAMILQSAYPQHFQSVTSQFFQTSIKRRLVMLSKLKNPKVAYLSRVVALPLVAVLILSFSIRTKQDAAPAGLFDFALSNSKDTLPKKPENISSVNVDKKKGEITIRYKDGRSEVLTEKQAVEKGMLSKESKHQEQHKSGVELKAGGAQPLFFVDGKEVSKADLDKLDPGTIKSVNVLKGKSATAKYGEKGKDGVVEVETKKAASDDEMIVKANGNKVQLRTGNTTVEANEITITGHRKDKIIARDEVSVSDPAEKPASVDVQAWRVFLEKNLQTVIAHAAAKGAKPGNYTVKVRFLVKTDGSISDFMALNQPGFDLEKQVLAVLPDSPKWRPAELNGHPVNSYHTQPITFVIQEM